MSPFRNAIAALLAAACLATAANAATVPVNIGSHYSDMWWNPQESGWAMNVVQQGETALVTLLVYGPDGAPAWYVATDARVFALDASGNPAFRGTLYKATGPWIGEPFDPAHVRLQAVGQLVIEPRAQGRLNLSYTAEGISVSKDVVRMTFSAPDLGTTYLASFSLRQARPGNAPHATRQFGAAILAHVEGDMAFLRVEDPQGRCEFRGTRTASGRFARIEGNFACENAEAGHFEIVDFEITQHGFSGFLRTYSAASNQYGRFAAARY